MEQKRLQLPQFTAELQNLKNNSAEGAHISRGLVFAELKFQKKTEPLRWRNGTEGVLRKTPSCPGENQGPVCGGHGGFM